MKKIIYFTLIALFSMTGASFAWTVNSGGVSLTSSDHHYDSIQNVKASKNVTIEVNSASQSYAASAGHKSGDKAYGVSSGSSLIMYTDKDKGDDWGTAPGASDSGAFSSWHSM